MFTGTKYITQGIKTNIPTFVQYILWHLIETMNIGQKDYFQVFQLEGVFLEGRLQQKIIHSQEEPNYRKEYTLFTKKIVYNKIFVIDDETHCTMLLAEEY